MSSCFAEVILRMEPECYQFNSVGYKAVVSISKSQRQ
jgi:hypothetical protein